MTPEGHARRRAREHRHRRLSRTWQCERSTLLRHADAAMYAAKRRNLGIALWDERYDQHSSGAPVADERSCARPSTTTSSRSSTSRRSRWAAASECTSRRWCAGGIRRAGWCRRSEFIAFAEQTGYIRAITQWVLAHADRAMRGMAQPTELPMNVSINLSARDLIDPELPERFEACCCSKHGCAAQWITLEITESAILDDPDHAIDNLAAPARAGLPSSRSTTTAPATRRSRTCGGCRCTSSRSTRRSSLGMARDDERRGHRPLDDRPRAQHGPRRSSPKASRTKRRSSGCARLGCDMVQGLPAQSSGGARRTLVAWMRSSVWTRAARDQGCCVASSEVRGSGRLARTDGFRKRRLIDYAVGLDGARGAFKTGIHGFLPASAGSARSRLHHAEEPRADGLDAHRARGSAQRLRASWPRSTRRALAAASASIVTGGIAPNLCRPARAARVAALVRLAGRASIAVDHRRRARGRRQDRAADPARRPLRLSPAGGRRRRRCAVADHAVHAARR